MNPVLKKILQTNEVEDGEQPLPLSSAMSADEGLLIDKVFRAIKPDISLEVGLAYGVSALHVCDALAANGKKARHIVIDAFQNSQWRGIGLKNIERAGYEHFIEFREERSEIALPKLLAEGTRVQAAIIDGFHTFDHTLIDFFYANKMLDVGGVVIIDDTDFPSIERLARHILTYPAYELFLATGQSDVVAVRTKIRKMLYRTTKQSKYRRSWDYPSCIAFRKIAEDNRSWDWHVDF